MSYKQENKNKAKFLNNFHVFKVIMSAWFIRIYVYMTTDASCVYIFLSLYIHLSLLFFIFLGLSDNRNREESV